MKSNLLKICISFVIGAIFIWLAVKDVRLENVLKIVSEVNLLTVLIFILLTFLRQLFRTIRWKILLDSIYKESFKNIFSAANIGFMAVMLIPFRLGEFVRPILITRKNRINVSKAFATVVVERVFDGIITIGMLIIAVIWFGHNKIPLVIVQGAYLALLIFGGGLFVIIISIVKKETTLFIFEKLLNLIFKNKVKKIEKLLLILESFFEGLNSFKSLKSVIMFIFWTIMGWIVSLLPLYILMNSMGMDVPFSATLVLIAFVTIAVLIPAGPALAGNFEYGVLLALSMYNISAEQSLAFAFIVHIIEVLFITILGSVLIVFHKQSVFNIFTQIKKIKEI